MCGCVCGCVCGRAGVDVCVRVWGCVHARGCVYVCAGGCARSNGRGMGWLIETWDLSAKNGNKLASVSMAH